MWTELPEINVIDRLIVGAANGCGRQKTVAHYTDDSYDSRPHCHDSLSHTTGETYTYLQVTDALR